MPSGDASQRLGRLFDGCVVVAGVTVAAVAAARVLTGAWTGPWLYLLAVPLIMVVARFPLLLDRSRASMEIGFDSCVLVFVVCTTNTWTALALWSLGVVGSQLFSDKRARAKAFNIGLGILSGLATTLVIITVRGSQLGTPRELLAVGIGCAVYFGFDLLASAVSLGLEDGVSPWRDLARFDALVAAAIVVVFDSLGFLAALVVRQLPWWSVLLLSVPLAAMLVATRAVTRGRENARRMRMLFRASARLQSLDTEPQVQSAVREGARELLRVPEVEVRSEPPQASELGARFHDGRQERWIITAARHRARSSIHADQRALEALASVVTETFSRLRLSEQMTHLAQHDALTALPNRALFVDRLEHALQLTRRRGSRLAVLFCDLDGFKSVNDRFGHAAGDALLVEVAQRLGSCVRDSDTVARLGGDEFAVLLEDVHSEDRVSAVCERILGCMRDRIPVAGRQLAVTASLGVAYSDSAASADTLIRNADMAMYQAKTAGRDRVVVYELALGRAMVRQLELVESLRLALDSAELQVVYQPVVGVDSTEIVGLEALARWRDRGRDVSPDVFIRAAEESGLVVPLGELMFELVLRDVVALRRAHGRRLAVGVNISSQQLRSAAFVDRLERGLSRLGDVQLVLELTERQMASDDPLVLAAMTQLSGRGVRFAVDDFGVGFSSIGYLQQLPVHVFKTDRSFTQSIDDDERACRLLRSVVVMGEALGLDVVVEGVERLGQLEHLRTHVHPSGVQGFALHRPMPLDRLLDVLATGPARTRSRRAPEALPLGS